MSTKPTPSRVVAAAVPAVKAKPPAAGKGRVKGVPNKSTAAVKQALTEAFDQAGGVPALVRFAKTNPTDFYKLWAKLLPLEISGPNGGPIPVQSELAIRIGKLSSDDREQLRQLALKMDGG